ncbi:MAG: ABC transporter permease [Polyangiaceae bacterium]|nr:ABC transporter permease [Polyangiaceae bacterium]
MLRIALQSLAHDRGKLVASIAGVAFAATLVFAQVGLYAGFLQSSSAVIRHVGGDVWVMARGTVVVDNGERLSAGSREIAAAHPCVERVRGLVLSFQALRKPNGSLEAVQIVGFEPSPKQVLPWAMARGLPQDLHPPMRVAVDRLDVEKLAIEGDPIGAELGIGAESVRVAAVTDGIRAFTLAPYVFAELATARRLALLGADQAFYWVLDLARPECASEVVATVDRHPDLVARRTDDFREMTETYWVAGSGAGAALGFSALLGLVVGVVIVGQTLYAVTKEHLRELATLKAIGASPAEIVSFVAWQAAFLALVGGGLGLGMAFGVRNLAVDAGLTIVLSGPVLALGSAAVLLMCAVASLWSVRAVLALEAAEVFR